jgi:hypothetical protein
MVRSALDSSEAYGVFISVPLSLPFFAATIELDLAASSGLFVLVRVHRRRCFVTVVGVSNPNCGSFVVTGSKREVGRRDAFKNIEDTIMVDDGLWSVCLP